MICSDYITGRKHYNWVFPGIHERTVEDYPYSYSAHYIKGDAQSARGCFATYSDRLQQWDCAKYRECTSIVAKENKQSNYFWHNVNLKDCSKWMSLYYSKPIEVCAVAEECHQGNGYPLWIIFHKDIKNEVC